MTSPDEPTDHASSTRDSQSDSEPAFSKPSPPPAALAAAA